ncbi:MOSC domain-containing protein [Vannielia sp.]|uniref:MOSC domain-containing protein n=1 Tax=Vannielia sp. TaxID=2813045 RepID=UPI00260AEA60|nr:MOSC domain-containing protein [Vannielia sp.]MDF1872242.1 MOSC domain-containing protein [Vannielia sp.]
MAGLVKIEATATITWLGHVESREATLRSVPLERMVLGFEGPQGEDHGGFMRPSCSRVLALYPERGTEIRNTRQLSIISAEELEEIRQSLGLEGLPPSYLGASIVVKGLRDFSHIPPGTRLQAPSGATLTVDVENGPCNLPAREIEDDHPGHGKGFKAAAKAKRGVTAWVERPGEIAIGERFSLFIPDQPAWAGP